MADAYWRYGEALQQAAAAASMVAPSAALKRQRTDYADDRGTHRVIRDTESIGASYDRYLRNGVSAYPGGEPVRTVSGGISGHPVDDRRMLAVGGLDSRSVGYGGRPEPPLPPDASNTLFVEGVPANCTRREVSHIFRPFVGFREVRLVNKESRHPDGEPLILCFVDFATPAQAAISLEALQGYKFDENDRDSANLRLQFARFPGPRPGGPRGRR
ncbi:protein MATERNALLY EXPRESSED GENE 5-like isoform X3 [Zingiber officinale]|uniref:protein MATERNALLY EXPRESSED GENE 5-like isoform X3 n=1 Tax=Zingiber officinale TaxID=94328 RepID=UPI001C4DB3D1|nr:protein MATERNALLY EXPRESSED GENE 5-like isoform X3 [Zingiber officinale]XP_042436633.1 protein MATERNALLY EXPRESSED GENE 5-like isoform X3 [Zingiber officinale]